MRRHGASTTALPWTSTCFSAHAQAEALERALPDDERAVLPLVWRAGVDDWDAYLCSHFRHIRYHHFKQAACAPTLKDNGL